MTGEMRACTCFSARWLLIFSDEGVKIQEASWESSKLLLAIAETIWKLTNFPALEAKEWDGGGRGAGHWISDNSIDSYFLIISCSHLTFTLEINLSLISYIYADLERYGTSWKIIYTLDCLKMKSHVDMLTFVRMWPDKNLHPENTKSEGAERGEVQRTQPPIYSIWGMLRK